MLSIVFDLKELALQNQESLLFAAYAMNDLHTIFITSGASEEENKAVLQKCKSDRMLNEFECYDSVEDFMSSNEGKLMDWFLIFTSKGIQKNHYGDQFVFCPYEFWGSMAQFEHNSFTEHAKQKLLYNELSWLYMDSIANDTELEVEFLKSILKKHNVESILDCCCGVGRHARRLGETGFKVMGVDASNHQISTALKQNSNQNVQYCVSDARTFKLPEKYDAGICMWTTYNYFSKERDIIKFLDNMYAHLGEKGVLVLDSKNIPILDTNRLYHRRNQRDGMDLVLLIYKRIIGAIQNSQYFYFINNGSEKYFFMDEEFVRFYSVEELVSLNKNRFKLLNIYGDFNGNAYDVKKSERMITIWEKC